MEAAPPAAQRTFATPQEAAQALASAAQDNDTAALMKILGPEGKAIVSSGDPAEDKAGRAQFARLAAEKVQIRRGSGRPQHRRRRQPGVALSRAAGSRERRVAFRFRRRPG
jgi:hypothetical protein